MWAAVPQSWSALALEEFEQNLGAWFFFCVNLCANLIPVTRLENNSFVIADAAGRSGGCRRYSAGATAAAGAFFKGYREFRLRTLVYRSGDDAQGLLRRLQEK